jgi:adenylate cyclase
MDARLFDEFLGQSLMGLVSISVGVFLILNEPDRTRPNIAFGLFFVIVGLAAPTTALFAGQVDPDHVLLVERLHVLLEASAVACVVTYLKGVAETTQSSPGVRRYVRTIANLAYVLSGVFVVLGATFTATRLNEFSFALDSWDDLSNPGFWMFGSFWVVLAVLFSIAWVLLSRQEVDRGERTRAISYSVATPLITTATFLPVRLAFLTYTLAIVASLFGIFRYFAVQGERAAFLSRFLSPQVAELVRLRGLTEVMQPQEVDLSVVCIDFRGFTAYAEAVPSQAVIDLISEYHEAIAEAVGEHGGMVKDYAGDGILILVGAPITRPDHADAALSLARSAMVAARIVAERWATGPHPLGVGIGVASGRVTVGAIGDAARMDYTAVGSAVNIASRLCGSAEDGAILLDQNTARAVDEAGCDQRGELELKGMSVPVMVYAAVTGS